jgi:hypothetical protein
LVGPEVALNWLFPYPLFTPSEQRRGELTVGVWELAVRGAAMDGHSCDREGVTHPTRQGVRRSGHGWAGRRTVGDGWTLV